ncbi:MAG TPA: hypothetical protein VFB73_13765 [Chloroflexota bacterium]|nr:hypothetical protein [Chloroflexota bacterium]
MLPDPETSTAPATGGDQLPVIQGWSAAALAATRRGPRLLVLLVDTAWTEVAVADRRDAWLQALLPTGRPPAIGVIVDGDAFPDVALRLRWTLRLFDAEEALPYVGLFAVRPRDGRLLPLHALGGPLTAAKHAAREAALARWAQDRATVEALAAQYRRALAASARRGWRASPPLARHLAEGVAAIMAAMAVEPGDTVQGAVPTRPAVLALLLALAARGDASAATEARRLLQRLARSGMRDPLDGGFFHGVRALRQPVPDFARTAADNAALLAVYSQAAAQLGDADCAAVARGIAAYLLQTLRDPATGTFYASQAADEPYYTWTSREVAAALPFQLVQVACLHFNIQPAARLFADPRKNLLYVAMDEAAIARFLGQTRETVADQLAAARRALLAARQARPAPPIDRTRYVDVNAQVAWALLAGAAALGEPDWREAALETLAALEAACFASETPRVPHRLPAGVPLGPYLSDHAALGYALLAAYAHTGQPRYLARAVHLADTLLAYFRDPRTGALLDVPPDSLTSRAFWAEQPLEDPAGPSPVAAAAQFLLALWRHSGEERYRQRAVEALRAGARAAADDPRAAAGYYLALAALLHGPSAASPANH